MVATASAAIPDADVVLFVTDVSRLPSSEDREIAKLIQERADAPAILVLNKMDLLPPEKVKAHVEAHWDLAPYRRDWMMTRATTGANLDKLLDLVVALLPEGPRYYPGDQVTDQTEREIAAELVREQVLRHTRQEVPHAVAVVVDEFKEREGDAFYVSASVFVEKDSQKGIIIGKGGQMLRQIGTSARQEIERMVGGRVYLDLHVRVRKNWRQSDRDVRRMGYGPHAGS
jgi:GTP-binding protein Era